MIWVLVGLVSLGLLFAFPKQFGIFVLIVIGAGVAGFFWIDQANRNVMIAREKDRSQIQISAGASKTVCTDPKWPIWVSFKNNSAGKTANSVDFSIAGYRAGHSSPTMEAYSLTSDRILAPGQLYTACWSISTYGGKQLAAGETYESLQWVARTRGVTWR